jgi:hypothetical protein
VANHDPRLGRDLRRQRVVCDVLKSVNRRARCRQTPARIENRKTELGSLMDRRWVNDEPRDRQFYQLTRELAEYVSALRPSGDSPSGR